MRGTVTGPVRIFWHLPEALAAARALYGERWNPDDCTEEQEEEIACILAPVLDVKEVA